MGIGFALGGVAKGLESAEQSLARNRALDLREQTIQQDKDLRERALGIQEQNLARQGQNDLLLQGNKVIGEHLKVISEIAGSNAPPEQKRKAMEPLLADIDALGGQLGIDTDAIRNRVDASLAIPPVTPSPKVGSTLEQARADFVAGKATPEQKQLIQDATLSLTDRMLLGLPIPGVDSSQGKSSIGEKKKPKRKDEGAAFVMEDPIPVPSEKDDLVVGQVYILQDGRKGKWDGEAFDIVQ